MAESTAWILDFGNSIRAAVGELNLVHLEEQAKLFAVPKTPDYCRYTLIWQDSILPVIDMLTGLQGQSISRETSYVAIIRYQRAAHEPLLEAGLLLSAMPIRMLINDAQACPLPAQPQAWQSLADSCFTLDNESIPIMDLAAIFSRTAQSVLGGKKII